MPAVICINNPSVSLRLPLVSGYIKAQNNKYKTYTLYDLSLDINLTGLKGSPTRVKSVYKASSGRNCRYINTVENPNYVECVLSEITLREAGK